MSDSGPPAPDQSEGWARTLNHALELWVNPEIERRRGKGSLGADFSLHAFQVLFPADANEILVRLNREIRGFAMVRAIKPIEPGELVSLGDCGPVEDFELDAAELDYGHFTALQHVGTWTFTFNFLRGRAAARAIVDRAEQFARTSELATEAGLIGPAVDNLFSATELVAKAILIMHLQLKGRGKSHGPIGSAINNWAKLGNISADFVSLYNSLQNARPTARYLDRDAMPNLPTNGAAIVHREIGNIRRHWEGRPGDRLLRP